VPVTEEEFNNLNDLLNDPLIASELTLSELDEIDGLITDFQTSRAEGRQKLEGEGFSPEQIDELNAAKNPNVNTGAEQTSALGPSILPTGRALAGVKEGATRAVEGVLDLAKDISVGIGMEDEASRQEWKTALNQDRFERRKGHLEEFGQLPSGSFEFMGEVAPWMAALPASAESFTMTLAQRLLQGAAIGGSTVQGKDDTLVDRAANMSIASGIGGSTSLLSVWPAFKKSAAKGFARSYNDVHAEQAERVEKLVQQMTDNPEFAFSLAQVTGNRTVLALEIGSAAAATKAAQNKNIGTLVTNLLKTAQRMAGTGKSAGQIAGSLRATMKQARTSIYDAASLDWRLGTEAVLAKHGDDVVVQGKTYLDKIDKLIGEAEDGLVGVGGRAGPELKAYRAEVDSIVNPVRAQRRTVEVAGSDPRGPRRVTEEVFDVVDRRSGQQLATGIGEAESRKMALAANEKVGGVTSDESLRLLKGLNKLIAGDVAIFEKASVGSNRSTGRALMGSFTDELTAAKNPTAAADLGTLRTAYKDQMARAQAIDDTVVAAAFGGKKMPKEPGKRLDAILKGEKEDLVATREFLEEWNPQLLDDLRATHLNRIVKGSAKGGTTPAVDLQTTVTGIANRLTSTFGRSGQAGKGLHTAAVQADMLKTASALRILNNKYIKGVAPGGAKIDDLAINVISRSPEFMARFVTRALAGGQSLERVLLDPSARKALQTLATAPLQSRKGQAAMVLMAGFINSEQEARRNREQNEASRIQSGK
jgi:hypothetical protein